MFCVAGSGWATVAVGSPLGSQLGYLANLRDAVAAEPRSSRDRGSGTARRHLAAADYALTGLALISFSLSGIRCAACSPAARRLRPRRAGRALNVRGPTQYSRKVRQPCRPALTSSNQRRLATCTERPVSTAMRLVHTEEIREVGICPFPGVRRETGSRDH